MTSFFDRARAALSPRLGLHSLALLLGAALTGPAWADIELRVEGRPASDPIQAFVIVTDGNGDPVEGLSADDFRVWIDGDPQTIADGDVTLPPAEDAAQSVSVVFVMDYSVSVTDVALESMQQAVTDFVEAMDAGDQAAIVKFNDTLGPSIVVPFTTIDDGGPNDQAIFAAVLEEYPGDGTNLLDALDLAVNHILAPPAPLPEGPKAVILISDGGENRSEVSESEVIALANANSIPVFTIGVGDLSLPGRDELLAGLGEETGGHYFPTATDEEIQGAYATISLLLAHEYLISIPSGIADCQEHTMRVAVGPQSVTSPFTRRTCDSEPNAFSFASQTGVDLDRQIESNTVTIEGLEVPAHISVISGRYSIGCTDTFTQAPGTIANGQEVCVRHQSSAEFSTSHTTTLTIGGVAATFTTTTRAEGSGGGGGGGGGGATGLLELLLALGALFFARRRLLT
jgi:VWFA-related protein